MQLHQVFEYYNYIHYVNIFFYTGVLTEKKLIVCKYNNTTFTKIHGITKIFKGGSGKK